MNLLKGVCCWGTDYCKCEFLKLARNQNIKLGYILFLIVTICITAMVSALGPASPTLIQAFDCNTDSADPLKQQQCVEEQLMFRWMMSLAVLHLLLFVVVMLRSQLSKIVNEGAWMLKIFILIGLGFMFVYVFKDTMLYALQVCGGYLVPLWYFLQTLIVIDLIYSIENGLKQLSQTYPKMQIVKALISLLSVMGAVVVNVLSYVHHSESANTKYLSIISSVQLAIFLLVCMLRIVKGNTLLVYGLIMLYSNVIAYYLHCPSSEPNHTFYIIQIILVIVSLLGVLSSGSNKIRTRKSSLNQILALNTSREDDDNRYMSSNKWIVFHLIFFLICFALPYVINQAGESFYYPQNGSNEWANFFGFYRILGWFFILIIYLWTLVAAKIYPDQDFDELENYFREFQLN